MTFPLNFYDLSFPALRTLKKLKMKFFGRDKVHFIWKQA